MRGNGPVCVPVGPNCVASMKCEYRWRPTIEWYPIVPDVLLATTVLVKFARVDDEVASPADLASISALISIEFVVAVPVDEVARLMN